MVTRSDRTQAKRVDDLAYRELVSHSGVLFLGLLIVVLVLDVTTWALGQFSVADLVVLAVLAAATGLAWWRRIPAVLLPWTWSALAVLVVGVTCLQMVERQSMMQLGYLLVACTVFPPLVLFWRPAILGAIACTVIVAVTGAVSYPLYEHEMWGKLEPVDAVLQTIVALAAGCVALQFRRRSLSGAAVETSMLETRAMTDGLTGVLNRRGIEELGVRLVARAGALGRPAFVLFIDVNGLKAVNDTRGHDVGDEVIRTVALAARQVVREGDLLGRWGGDEFVIIGAGGLPDPSMVSVRLSEALERVGAGRLWADGVSVGGASGRRPYADLVAEADADMYARRDGQRGGTSSPE